MRWRYDYYVIGLEAHTDIDDATVIVSTQAGVAGFGLGTRPANASHSRDGGSLLGSATMVDDRPVLEFAHDRPEADVRSALDSRAGTVSVGHDANIGV